MYNSIATACTPATIRRATDLGLQCWFDRRLAEPSGKNACPKVGQRTETGRALFHGREGVEIGDRGRRFIQESQDRTHIGFQQRGPDKTHPLRQRVHFRTMLPKRRAKGHRSKMFAASAKSRSDTSSRRVQAVAAGASSPLK